MKIFVLVVLLFYSFLSYSQNKATDFIGYWVTDKDVEIHITEDDGVLTGIATQKGLTVLKEIEYKKDNWKGTVINAQGKEASCTLELKGNTLEIKAKKGMMSKTITWNRKEQ